MYILIKRLLHKFVDVLTEIGRMFTPYCGSRIRDAICAAKGHDWKFGESVYEDAEYVCILDSGEEVEGTPIKQCKRCAHLKFFYERWMHVPLVFLRGQIVTNHDGDLTAKKAHERVLLANLSTAVREMKILRDMEDLIEREDPKEKSTT